MKKIASVLTATALALGMVACAKPEEKKPEPKAEAPKVVEEKPAATAAAPGTPATAARKTRQSHCGLRFRFFNNSA